jgi:hypothetical protein
MRFTYHRRANRGARVRSPLAIILGFIPAAIFTLLASISLDLALWAGLSAAFVVSIRDFAQEPILRLLDMGSLVLFGLTALYAGFIHPAITIQLTRFVIDAGFFALALLSILVRNPLTLQYAREQVSNEVWKSRPFVLTNYGLTALWMLCFAVMAAADAFADMHKNLPASLDAALCLIVVVAALVVTARYPNWLRGHAARFRTNSS